MDHDDCPETWTIEFPPLPNSVAVCARCVGVALDGIMLIQNPVHAIVSKREE